MQLRFASLAVINSREDLHLQECAHAGRTKKKPGGVPGFERIQETGVSRGSKETTGEPWKTG